MSTIQPQSTDPLNSPDHSLLHRQIAADTSAPVKSIEVLADGTTIEAHNTATTAVTQSQADNSTKLATTAYVDTGLGTKAPTASPVFTGNVLTDFAEDRYFGTWYETGSNYRIGFDTIVSIRAMNIHSYSPVGDPTGIITFNTGTVATPVTRMKIANTGAVQMTYYGAGAATFDASGNITSVSDERLKDIQGDFSLGLPEVLKLQPKLFKYNTLSGLDTENVYTGLIAQDVMKYIPEAVSKDPQGYYTFNDRAITCALINAVKELQAEVDELRSNQKLPKKEYKVTEIIGEDRIIKSKLAEINPKVAK